MGVLDIKIAIRFDQGEVSGGDDGGKGWNGKVDIEMMMENLVLTPFPFHGFARSALKFAPSSMCC